MHGFGVYLWKNGDRYEGNYQNGVKEGIGKYFYASGPVYEGAWAQGVQHGRGKVKEGFDEV